MTRFNNIFVFIISLTFIISCESDDNNGPIVSTDSGFFSIDNDTFDLSQGFITNSEEEDPGLYYQTLILSGDGFSFSNGTFTGRTDAVIIEVYSNSSDNSFTETYTITDANTYTAGQAYAYYAVNYDIDNDTVDDEEDIESGTLTVALNSDGTYNLTLTNGQVDITGQAFTLDYQGAVRVISQ